MNNHPDEQVSKRGLFSGTSREPPFSLASNSNHHQSDTTSNTTRFRGQHTTRPFSRGRGRFAGRGGNISKSFNKTLNSTSVDSDTPTHKTPPKPMFTRGDFPNFANESSAYFTSNEAVNNEQKEQQPQQPFTITKPTVIGAQETSKEDRALRFSSKPQDNKYEEMKKTRVALRQAYIRQGKLADPDNVQHLSKAIQFVGECQDMCPEYERYERELQMGLDPLEKIEGTDFVDHERAVKRFRRSAAGDEEALPCDVRPPNVLVGTLDYLINDVLGVHGLEKSYSFVRDRARAIRKDFFLQNYRGMEAVECHERIARYHIMCAHVLCENPNVSLQQEHEQLRKTLQSLREYYVDLAKENQYSPNEAEFQAYYILSHLYQNEFVTRAESFRPQLFNHPLVQLAIELHTLSQRTNDYTRGHARTEGSLNAYSRLFRLVASPRTPYLVACVLHISFVSIRRGCLKAMQKAFYCVKGQSEYSFSFEEMVEMLGLDGEEDLIAHLEYYEIPFDQPQKRVLIGRIVDPAQDKRINRKALMKEDQRASFPPKVSHKLIEHKRQHLTQVEIVQGHGPTEQDVSGSLPRTLHPTFSLGPLGPLDITPTVRPCSFSSAIETKRDPIESKQAPVPQLTDKDLLLVVGEMTLELLLKIVQCEHSLILEDHYRNKLIEQQRLFKQKKQQDKLLEQQAALELAVDAFIHQVSIEISSRMIEEFTSAFVLTSLLVEKEIGTIQSAYSSMLEALISQVILEECQESLWSARADFIRACCLKRFSVRNWRNFTSKKIEKRRRLQRQALYLLDSMRDFCMTDSDSQQRSGKTPSLWRVDMFGRRMESRIDLERIKGKPGHVQNGDIVEIDGLGDHQTQSSDVKTLEILEIFASKSLETPQFIKVCMGFSVSFVKEMFYADKFMIEWLFEQIFGPQLVAIESLATNSSIALVYENELVNLCFKVLNIDLLSGQGMCHCIASNFLGKSDAFADTDTAECASCIPNGSSSALGKSAARGSLAAVYTLSLYNPSLSSVNQYIQAERRRLDQFLAMIDDNAPLLLIVPTTRLLPLQQIIHEFAPISNTTQWMPLSLSNDQLLFDFEKKNSKEILVNSLSWLSANLLRAPLISHDLLWVFNLTMPHFKFLLSSLPSNSVLKIDNSISFFNLLIEMYNLQLSLCQQVLFNETAQLLSWPPEEFQDKLGISVGWNSAYSLSRAVERLDALKLELIQPSPSSFVSPIDGSVVYSGPNLQYTLHDYINYSVLSLPRVDSHLNHLRNSLSLILEDHSVNGPDLSLNTNHSLSSDNQSLSNTNHSVNGTDSLSNANHR